MALHPEADMLSGTVQQMFLAYKACGNDDYVIDKHPHRQILLILLCQGRQVYYHAWKIDIFTFPAVAMYAS